MELYSEYKFTYSPVESLIIHRNSTWIKEKLILLEVFVFVILSLCRLPLCVCGYNPLTLMLLTKLILCFCKHWLCQSLMQIEPFFCCLNFSNIYKNTATIDTLYTYITRYTTYTIWLYYQSANVSFCVCSLFKMPI